MTEPGAPAAGDRRLVARGEDVRLSELTLPEIRRIVVTTALFGAVAGLFLWMVRDVLVAGLLGAVTAAYLRPLYRGALDRLGRPALASLVTIAAVVIPLALALGYAYTEIVRVATYVRAHEGEVATRLARAIHTLGLDAVVSRDADLDASAREWVTAAAAYGAAFPGVVRAAMARGAVAASILLFTVVYILTDAATIGGYLRGKVSRRYTPLVGAVERNVRAVIRGTVYGAVVTQALKSAVVLALNLAFGVPLAWLLALLSFVLGFFPIVGSWSVYVPVAAWLFAFRGAPGQALAVLLVGFVVNTVFISMYLRPKLAAERSRVLDFYWMFVGLVTGVYAFGLPGVVLGPALIAMLKAVVDAVTEPTTWPVPAEDAESDDAAGAGAVP